MKHAEILSSRRASETDWQVLGELELLIGPEWADVIDIWMREKLNPLKLHADFEIRARWGRALHRV